MTRKIFILDTNVLLMNPEAIFSFEDNEVIIPLAVVEEIDDMKNKSSDLGYNARETSRILDRLRTKGKLSEGVEINDDGILKVIINGDTGNLPEAVDLKKVDNRIINSGLTLSQKYPERRIILVSNDINLRLVADAFGLEAEEHRSDRLSEKELYSGFLELSVTKEIIDEFFRNNKIPFEKLDRFVIDNNYNNYNNNNDSNNININSKSNSNNNSSANNSNSGINFYPNEFVQLINQQTSRQSALGIIEEDYLGKLRYQQREVMGIKPLNREQTLAFELLLRDEINLITLAGKAGTGKTLLALAAGLEKVVNEDIYTRILVARPVIPMGKDIGFLPGTKEDKLQPWMQPIFDNLDFILKKSGQSDLTFNKLVEREQIQIEPLTYIRGRSVPEQFIIIDEAQNLSKHEVKTIITRVGKDSKIVLTGDPFQIDNPFLDRHNNGLSHLASRLRNEKISGHILLTKGERSELARIASEKL